MNNTEYQITSAKADESIAQEIFLQVGFKTSICILIANTGHEAIGSYSPVSIDDFDVLIGKTKAREEAFRKIITHLESISQWKKAIHDMEKAKREEKEESKAAAKEDTI